jgi:K+ transporter
MDNEAVSIDLCCAALKSRIAPIYFRGLTTISLQVGGGLIVGIHRVPEAIFSYLNRNAVHEMRRYGMPMQQVVEIGTQIYL